MFPQPGVGNLQRVPILRAAEDVDRKTHADGGCGSILLHDRRFPTLERRRNRRGHFFRLPGGKSSKIAAQFHKKRFVVPATQADHEILTGEVLCVKRLDIVERDARNAGNGPRGNVAVRSARKEIIIQNRLPQLLIAGIPKGVLQRAQDAALDPIQVGLCEGRRCDRVDQQRIIVRQVVLMHAARDRGHLHRGLGVISCRQRV